MNLGEIRELTSRWSEEPPLVLLVEALVKGLSGDATASKSPIETQINNDLGKFRSAVDPRAIPVVRQDTGLPSRSPIFDIAALQERNRRIIAEAHLKKTQNAGE